MKKVWISIIVFLIMWLSILLQINWFNVVTLAGTVANLGIVIVVAIGLMCDKTIGGIIGFVYGLMLDIVCGKSIGIYLLSYMLLGLVSGKIGKGFSKDNKTTLIAMVGISTLVFEIFTYVFRDDCI